MLSEELLEVERAPVGLGGKYDMPSESPSLFKENQSDSSLLELPQTKKEIILSLYKSGVTDVAQIVRQAMARPSYVAQVLQGAGLISGYFDLYTTTALEQNIYSRFFRNVLSFKNVEAAKLSIEKIDRLFNYFDRLGDRAGQHQAMVLALTGKNRARWSGKTEEARVFSDWLAAH